MRCDECQFAMLDELYGLLEPAESASLAAHVASCESCAAAFAKAKADQALIQKASTASFPALKFAPPVELPPVVPSEYAEPGVKTSRQAWMGWAIAAGLLLAAAGTLGPAVRQSASYLSNSNQLEVARRQVRDAELQHQLAKVDYDTSLAMADRKVAEAKRVHNELIEQWVSAEKTAANSRPFAVTVRGPAAVIPGAPNDYAIAAVNDDERVIAANIIATLKGKDGKEYFRTSTETQSGRETTVRIPASAWTSVSAQESLTLHVVATNPTTKQTSELTEPVRMMDAAFSTVLTTDAPLYRPGDTIRFRSLTLDRIRFQPPDRDLNLAYALLGPDNQIVKGLAISGTTRLESFDPNNRIIKPILGPDGKPVRGVGCGEFVLPSNQGNGNYKLAVYELPAGWSASTPPPNAMPLATRPILILSYATHQWVKTLTFEKLTYGPGDNVTAKIRVTDKGQPVANAVLMIDATADTLPVIALDHPPTTDKQGQATIRFGLPKNGELKQATLRVSIIQASSKTNETIVRPIPLVPRSMRVEFFPEGGDLVAGVPNRVYVRGRLPNGKPADFAGTITDGTTAIATVQSETDADHPGANRGVGVFTFTPKAGTSYQLNLSRPIGLTTMTAKLPAVKADGVVLTIPEGVVAASKPIKVNVVSTQPRKLVIGAYSRGTPVAHAAVTIEPGVNTPVDLQPDAGAPGGVTRITVFEEPSDATPGRKDLRAVAERLIYRSESKRLDLSIRVKSNEIDGGETPGGATQTPSVFLPGHQASFDVTAKNERGEPVPAIIYAAIADEMLYGTVDDHTDRSLPSHFLLNGEVQNPDALERADFLLSDHPKAALALDRLLGTQGWRRFAEQNPSEFRKTAKPDDADRLLLAVGSRAPVPRDLKPAVQRVNETYRPKYESALTAWELAEAERVSLTFEGEKADAVASAAQQYQPAMQQVNEIIREMRSDLGDDDERSAGTYAAMLLAGIAVSLLIVRFTLLRNSPERGLVFKAALVLIVLLVPVTWVNFKLVPKSEEMKSITKELWKPIHPQSNVASISVNRNPPAGSSFEGDLNPKSFPFVPTPNPVDFGAGILLQADRWNTGSRSHSPSEPVEMARIQRLNELKERVKEAPPDSEKVVKSMTSQAPFLVREYAHEQPTNDTRSNFSEVLYWNPLIVIPGEGTSLSAFFQLSDSITSYRVTVAGHTLDGRLGQAMTNFTVNKPLVAGAKVPAEVGMGDVIDAVATVRANEIAATPNLYVRSSNLKMDANKELEKQTILLEEDGTARRTVRLTPSAPGSANVQVWAIDQDARLRDIVQHRIHVMPAGFPVSGAVSTMVERTGAFTVPVPKDRIPGTLDVKIKAYPNPLAELEAGIVGIARGPAGCFEQSTSLAYPNVLLLQWLEANEWENSNVAGIAQQARESLSGSYRSLLKFECEKPDGKGREGFEWFGGNASPHESLTAYGLLHFTDLKRVYSVEPSVVERTKQYLLSRRDGKGGFQQNNRAQDSFGRAPTTVANAYITWALSESDHNLDLKLEREAVANESQKSRDPYRLALAALSDPQAKRLLDSLQTKQKDDGSMPGAETSITNSAGPDLITETTALAVLAWSRAGEAYSTNVRKGLTYLVSRRQPGGTFGATQATVLALKAITEASRTMPKLPANSSLILAVNGRNIGPISLTDGRTFTAAEAESWFANGNAEFKLESTAGIALPVTLEWNCRTNDPPKSGSAKLTFTTALAKSEAIEGEVVQLNLAVGNTTVSDHGMIVTTIGLPAGLTIPTDAKQLAEITNRANAGECLPVYWERRGRDLVLYWRAIPASKQSSISIDLIAEFPGKYRGAGSKAYPYYNPQSISHSPPLAITVNPR